MLDIPCIGWIGTTGEVIMTGKTYENKNREADEMDDMAGFEPTE
jgi:hypothetical protein